MRTTLASRSTLTAAAALAVAACTVGDLDPEGKACPCDEAEYACVGGQCIRAGGGSAYAMEVLADSPLAYYPLDESEAGAVVDATGGGNDGSYVAGATPGAPALVAGTAARLDGTGGRLRFGDRFDFGGQAPFTLEAWIQPDRIGTFERIFAKEDGGVAGREGYTVFLARFDSPFTVGFERWAEGNLPGGIHTDEPINAGEIRHLVVVYDGDESVIYLDGEESQRGSNSASMIDRTTPFIVGAASSQDSSFFQGVIDEIAIYDRVLDPTRIRAHYDAGR